MTIELRNAGRLATWWAAYATTSTKRFFTVHLSARWLAWPTLLAGFLLAGVLPTQAHEQQVVAKAGEPSLGVSAAFDTQDRLWMVDARDGHVWLHRSNDLGRSFQRPVAVNETAEPIYAEGENRPKLALGPGGEIYVSWSQPRAQPYSGFVRLARSLDGGAHFLPPVTVHQDTAEITHRFDALAVDGQGRVLVAWIDKRDMVSAKSNGQSYPGAAIYYSWSSDRGGHFAPERKLVDHTCECCRIALARSPEGQVSTFFRAIYDDNVRDHAYALLTPDGAPSAVRRATFSGWQIAGCPHQGPGLAVGHHGAIHATWFEASDGPSLWYGQLEPGHPPARPLKLGGAGAAHADVAADGQHVWLAWNQVDDEGYALVLRESIDGGTNFTPPRVLAHSRGSVGSPQVLVRSGRAYVAWNTIDGFHLLPTSRDMQ